MLLAEVLKMEIRTNLWGAVIVAAAAGVAIWAAAKVGADSERRLQDEATKDKRDPTLTR
jgi:hypothetical protein